MVETAAVIVFGLSILAMPVPLAGMIYPFRPFCTRVRAAASFGGVAVIWLASVVAFGAVTDAPDGSVARVATSMPADDSMPTRQIAETQAPAPASVGPAQALTAVVQDSVGLEPLPSEPEAATPAEMVGLPEETTPTSAHASSAYYWAVAFKYLFGAAAMLAMAAAVVPYGPFKTHKGAREALGGAIAGFVAFSVVASFSTPESAKSTAHRAVREANTPSVLTDEECVQELECWWDRHRHQAHGPCAREIERLASYSIEWTASGWSSWQRFTHMRRVREAEGAITYIGDKARFQNGFGAWANVVYECDYDPASQTVLNVRVRSGRL